MKTDGTGTSPLPPKVQGVSANQNKRAEGGPGDWTKAKGGATVEASRNKPLRSSGGSSSSRRP
jgi:hypothetical protein